MHDDFVKEPFMLALEHNHTATIAPISTVDNLPKKISTSDKIDSKSPKMKKWPDKNRLVNYDTLVKPIKEILERGYRLTRLITFKNFEYNGYNIGKNEQRVSPVPKFRFTEKGLDLEAKRGKSLFDVALNVMFLLGVEQGRRAENTNKRAADLTVNALETYREDNKNLRLRIDTLEASLLVRAVTPELSGTEFEARVAGLVKSKRDARMRAAKRELQLDLTRSSFVFHTPRRASFKELKQLAIDIDKTQCSTAQWKEIIKGKGWSYKDWKAACKKKSFANPFVTTTVSSKADTKQ